jgi:hypothetical protein
MNLILLLCVIYKIAHLDCRILSFNFKNYTNNTLHYIKVCEVSSFVGMRDYPRLRKAPNHETHFAVNINLLLHAVFLYHTANKLSISSMVIRGMHRRSVALHIDPSSFQPYICARPKAVARHTFKPPGTL